MRVLLSYRLCSCFWQTLVGHPTTTMVQRYLIQSVCGILDIVTAWRPIFRIDPMRAWTVSLCILDPATKVLVTVLIVLRLSQIRRRHKRLFGKVKYLPQLPDQKIIPLWFNSGESSLNNLYTNLAAMFFDSYAIPAIWFMVSMAILLILRCPIPSPLYLVFPQSAVNVKIISLLQVVYRGLRGRAWEPQTGRQITSLRFDNPARPETSEVSEGPPARDITSNHYAPSSERIRV
ncbi:hypothetical protein AN958_00496 [Leucoagaricus sp. SymC.cos]|nr:hypothetical protein AN958_00496 [Leucoagaricus sp. SymC.cos]